MGFNLGFKELMSILINLVTWTKHYPWW